MPVVTYGSWKTSLDNDAGVRSAILAFADTAFVWHNKKYYLDSGWIDDWSTFVDDERTW